ncbi:hypothetical protein BCF11_4854 [Collimonas sp. PA-H2]|nr:hypothetical protein BCF11_4854 [Collimonas sp. PA-H2]
MDAWSAWSNAPWASGALGELARPHQLGLSFYLASKFADLAGYPRQLCVGGDIADVVVVADEAD